VLVRRRAVCYRSLIMRKVALAVIAGGILLLTPPVAAQAGVYAYTDDRGTPHFTDAPTKPYYRPLPGFGLPPGVDLVHGQYAELIDSISAEHGVDPKLVKAIIRAESNFDQYAVSRAGAQGLMQLMPGTAGRYAVSNAFDPAENIRGGIRYLRSLHDMFPGRLPLVLAAYNAGENAVMRRDGIPPFPETREYVRRVLQFYGRPDLAVGVAPAQTTSRRPGKAAAAQVTPSPPSVYRTLTTDGTPHYTNLPPLSFSGGRRAP
jgi:soluble lytic murein transglycosylase-like protein